MPLIGKVRVMEFTILTGVSGSGKSTAVNALEDLGFYCIDNMPPELMIKFASLCSASDRNLEKVAFVADVRAGSFFKDLYGTIKELREHGEKVKVLFIDADDSVIETRYKETRRKHPLYNKSKGSILSSIALERDMLANVKGISDYFIDSSYMTAAQLKEKVRNIFLESGDEYIQIDVCSFGFKYGPMREADLVFDVRCLPNPYYIDELRKKTGLFKEVSDYVMKFDEAKELEEKLYDLVDFLIPLYMKEGKSQLIIAFGCTGGKHRSVTFAERMSKHLSELHPRVRVNHRDIDKYTR